MTLRERLVLAAYVGSFVVLLIGFILPGFYWTVVIISFSLWALPFAVSLARDPHTGGTDGT